MLWGVASWTLMDTTWYNTTPSRLAGQKYYFNPGDIDLFDEDQKSNDILFISFASFCGIHGCLPQSWLMPLLPFRNSEKAVASKSCWSCLSCCDIGWPNIFTSIIFYRNPKTVSSCKTGQLETTWAIWPTKWPRTSTQSFAALRRQRRPQQTLSQIHLGDRCWGSGCPVMLKPPVHYEKTILNLENSWGNHLLDRKNKVIADFAWLNQFPEADFNTQVFLMAAKKQKNNKTSKYVRVSA